MASRLLLFVMRKFWKLKLSMMSSAINSHSPVIVHTLLCQSFWHFHCLKVITRGQKENVFLSHIISQSHIFVGCTGKIFGHLHKMLQPFWNSVTCFLHGVLFLKIFYRLTRKHESSWLAFQLRSIKQRWQRIVETTSYEQKFLILCLLHGLAFVQPSFLSLLLP